MKSETINFSGQGRFCEISTVQQTFHQKFKKKSPHGKISEFFLLDALKTTF